MIIITLQEIIGRNLYQFYQCGSFRPSSLIFIQRFCMVKKLLQELNLITAIQIFCMSIETFFILTQINWILKHMQKLWIRLQMVWMMVQLEGQKLPHWYFFCFYISILINIFARLLIYLLIKQSKSFSRIFWCFLWNFSLIIARSLWILV